MLFSCFTGNCVACHEKQNALRRARTAGKWILSLRTPPQAENPAEQDSIFTLQNSGLLFTEFCYNSRAEFENERKGQVLSVREKRREL